MAINFPNSPILNEQYTYDNKTWEWNGTYWEVYSALTSYITSAYTVGDGISDISGVTGGNITLKSFSGVNIAIIDGGDKLTFSGSPQQNVSGLYLPLSGGTVTGDTIIQGSTALSNQNAFLVRNVSGVHGLSVTNDSEVRLGKNQLFYIADTSTGGYQFTIVATNSGVAISNTAAASRPVSFSMNTGEILRIHQNYTSIVNNNFLIGTTTDAGFKLDVNGTARISGNLSATGNYIQYGTNANVGIGATNNGSAFVSGGPSLLYATANVNNLAIYGHNYYTGNYNATSGIQGVVSFQNATFTPTSGPTVFNGFNLAFTINQTGGANGITRGIYVNPTLTSAADFRAIETTAGDVLFQTGSTRLLFVNSKGSGNGNVIIGNTTIDRGDKLQVEGSVRVGSVLLTNTIYPIQNSNLLISAAWADSTNVTIETITNKAQVLIVRPGANLTLASGTHDTQRITHTFQPTSGNASVNGLTLNQTINQLSGASGTTRGIYINPTISAATDFRAIETTTGNVIFGGTGSVGVGTDTSLFFKLVVQGGLQVRSSASSFVGLLIGDQSIRRRDTGTFALGTNDSATAIYMFAPTNNVGINTSTDAGYKLDVNGIARVGSSSASGQLYIKGLSGTGQYIYLDNGTGNGLWTIVGGAAFAIDSITTRILRANANAQVTINGNTNDSSAQFQIESTTRGFLPPRMTNAQRLAITSPAVALMVYCTDSPEGLFIYKSTGWVQMI
jgi:hypothetical protein